MNNGMTLDPRIKLIFLPAIGFMSFFISNTMLLSVFVVFSLILYIYSGICKYAFPYAALFLLSLGLEYMLEMISNTGVVFAVYMLLFFISRMTLIVMFGSYITRTTRISEMIEALNRLRVPRCISVPFSVLLRFAPTMRYEIKALKENIRIRGIMKSRASFLLHPVKCFEYTLIPLLLRMTRVSDELSASALIRGLDSDDKRVTPVRLKIKIQDVIAMTLGIVAGVSVVIIQKHI